MFKFGLITKQFCLGEMRFFQENGWNSVAGMFAWCKRKKPAWRRVTASQGYASQVLL
jgi:hypothetical protein